LGNARSLGERVQIADQFIVTQSLGCHQRPHRISGNGDQAQPCVCRIDSAHLRSGARNFQRMFQQRVGYHQNCLPASSDLKQPETKAARPHLSWIMGARVRYHDQMQ
jgi:hypothetical protein